MEMDFEAAERNMSRLLTENYMYLTNHISVTELIPFLVSRRAISSSDKEEVESMRIAVERRGKLIDIIKRQGLRGMKTFMTALEYIEPDVYFHLTKKVANPNDRAIREELRRVSSEKKRCSMQNFGKMMQYLNSMAQELYKSKETLNIAFSSVEDIQHQSACANESIKEEMSSMDSALEALDEKQERFQQLSREHVKTLQQLEEMKEKCAKLKRDNENYVTEHHTLTMNLSKLQKNHDELQLEHDKLFEDYSKTTTKKTNGPTKSQVHRLEKGLKQVSDLLSSREEDAKQKIEAQKKSIDVLTRSNLAYSVNWEKAIDDRNKSLAALHEKETDLKQREEEIERLKEHNEMLEKKVHELNGIQMSLLELREKEACLCKREAEIEQLKEKNRSLEKKLQELNEEIWTNQNFNSMLQCPLTPTNPMTGPFFGSLSPRYTRACSNNEVTQL